MKLKLFLLKFFLFQFSRYISSRLIIVYYFGQYFASLTCTSADCVCSSNKSVRSITACTAHKFGNSFWEAFLTIGAFILRWRSRASLFRYCALCFVLSFSDVLWAVRIAIATVSRLQKRSYLDHIGYVIVERAFRRSRSELLCAGVTVPNQSQIQACQRKSQHGPRISCLPSHDKCICCCLGIWITRASWRY